jgi:hypothetical protein
MKPRLGGAPRRSDAACRFGRLVRRGRFVGVIAITAATVGACSITQPATPQPSGAVASPGGSIPGLVSPATPGPAGSATAGAPTEPATQPTASTGASGIRHVVVVWLENREATDITAASMPYLYGLAQKYGSADRLFAVSHPSLPNYLAFWSGSTHGVTDDNSYDLSGPSLSSQLDTVGRSWRTYAQNYPTTQGCHTAATYDGGVDGPGVAGTYARKHVPAMSFTSVSKGPSCAGIQPLTRFDPTVALAFVAPNLCNDMHDCSPATGDAFLRAFLPSVFQAPDWAHTLLVVSFDEGTTDAHGGGRVFTLVARQGLTGLHSSTEHDHYGVLRTIEDLFGLPCLGAACQATPLTEFLP